MRPRAFSLLLVVVCILLAVMNAVGVRGASIRSAPRRTLGPRRALMTSIMEMSDPYDGVYALNAHVKEKHDDFYQQRKVDVPGSHEVVEKFNDDSVVRKKKKKKKKIMRTHIHTQSCTHSSYVRVHLHYHHASDDLYVRVSPDNDVLVSQTVAAILLIGLRCHCGRRAFPLRYCRAHVKRPVLHHHRDVEL